MFKAKAAKIARLNSSKATATVTDTTSGRTAVVDYTAVVPNAFMGVIGVNTTTLKGESTTATPIPTYIDFICCSTTRRRWAWARRPPTSPRWSTIRPTNVPSPVTM